MSFKRMTSAFQITTLPLPRGGRLGLCGLPGLGGDLASDIAAMIDWQPGIVLSMTEQHEMEEGGCGNLSQILARSDIPWIHLPIADFGALNSADGANWPPVSARLHRLLDEDRGVLLHCRGGQGRSGMIALRLLVERGEEPGEALKRLRDVRPGAVETAEQLEWASRP